MLEPKGTAAIDAATYFEHRHGRKTYGAKNASQFAFGDPTCNPFKDLARSSPSAAHDVFSVSAHDASVRRDRPPTRRPRGPGTDYARFIEANGFPTDASRRSARVDVAHETLYQYEPNVLHTHRKLAQMPFRAKQCDDTLQLFLRPEEALARAQTQRRLQQQGEQQRGLEEARHARFAMRADMGSPTKLTATPGRSSAIDEAPSREETSPPMAEPYDRLQLLEELYAREYARLQEQRLIPLSEDSAVDEVNEVETHALDMAPQSQGRRRRVRIAGEPHKLLCPIEASRPAAPEVATQRRTIQRWEREYGVEEATGCPTPSYSSFSHGQKPLSSLAPDWRVESDDDSVLEDAEDSGDAKLDGPRWHAEEEALHTVQNHRQYASLRYNVNADQNEANDEGSWSTTLNGQLRGSEDGRHAARFSSAAVPRTSTATFPRDRLRGVHNAHFQQSSPDALRLDENHHPRPKNAVPATSPSAHNSGPRTTAPAWFVSSPRQRGELVAQTRTARPVHQPPPQRTPPKEQPQRDISVFTVDSPRVFARPSPACYSVSDVATLRDVCAGRPPPSAALSRRVDPPLLPNAAPRASQRKAQESLRDVCRALQTQRCDGDSERVSEAAAAWQ